MYGGDGQEASKPLPVEEAAQWVQKLGQHQCAWIIEHDSQLLGEARLDNINAQDRRARLAIGFYNPEKLGLGLGQEATRLVLRYAFEELRLHRVDLRVLAYNVRAIRCYQKCGFTIEGRERESAFVSGEWHDDLIMGILESEFVPV
jgi:RimJ/RimL family protein N-acetyltransferase